MPCFHTTDILILGSESFTENRSPTLSGSPGSTWADIFTFQLTLSVTRCICLPIRTGGLGLVIDDHTYLRVSFHLDVPGTF